MKPIAVICEKRDYFKNFMRNVYGKDKLRFRMVTCLNHTRGIEFSDYITLGYPEYITGYDELVTIIKTRIR